MRGLVKRSDGGFKRAEASLSFAIRPFERQRTFQDHQILGWSVDWAQQQRREERNGGRTRYSSRERTAIPSKQRSHRSRDARELSHRRHYSRGDCSEGACAGRRCRIPLIGSQLPHTAGALSNESEARLNAAGIALHQFPLSAVLVPLLNQLESLTRVRYASETTS